MTIEKLSSDIFKCVVAHTPLVSLDLIVKHREKILLGRRINEPAAGYWFTPGGRIFKNETIFSAQKRIAYEELGMKKLPDQPKFLGVFEHFYPTGIFENVSTHYLNLAYLLEVDYTPAPPQIQHSEYRWFDVDELLRSSKVHKYVKIYFRKDKNAK